MRCAYCGGHSESRRTSCQNCGAPVKPLAIPRLPMPPMGMPSFSPMPSLPGPPPVIPYPGMTPAYLQPPMPPGMGFVYPNGNPNLPFSDWLRRQGW